VYIGISMGVMPAQQLVQTRAGARGAVFIDACLPAEEFGTWPEGVPAQIHGMEADPNFADGGDLDAARALVASTDAVELFLYPGDVHLFSDASLPSHDPAATELMLRRILEFLAGLG
jgi:dienelactone hydrolase